VPTLEDLQRESVWRSERVPDAIRELRQELLQHFDWEPWRIGTIGDEHHLKGYHRSRDWIQQSDYCTNRGYSVTESTGNRSGGSGSHIAGMDIITNEHHARGIVLRLQTAKASGRLNSLREIKLEHNPVHVHLGFDRSYANSSHANLFRLIVDWRERSERMVTVTATMPELTQGSEGSHVTTWQTLLKRHGFDVQVDGEFGPKTGKATELLQTKFGAESVDGVVGPETWCIGIAGEDQE